MTREVERSVDRLRIDVYVDEDSVLETMADDVRDGLTSFPKRLSPKYFYDAVGSELFEQITALPEYYLTRSECELLEEIADEVMDSAAPVQLVDLGSGSSSKTRLLLDTQAARRTLREYVPFDVSKAIIDQTAERLLIDYPFISIHGVVGDFELHLGRIPGAEGPRLVLFLGSTIGNSDPAERVGLLQQIKELLGPGDKLLIGVDVVKDVAALEAAYNDASGVTAAFNKNMLNVLNRGLGADFDLDAFDHRAFFNADASRIEMHLVPRSPQQVHISEIGLQISITPPETLWTESSYKFTEHAISEMLAGAGLRAERMFTNDRPGETFRLILAVAAD